MWSRVIPYIKVFATECIHKWRQSYIKVHIIRCNLWYNHGWYSFHIWRWQMGSKLSNHDDGINWKHFPRYPSWGNPPVTVGFPSQRPVMRSFAAFFDLRVNKPWSKQSSRRWFDTPSRPLWHHSNVFRIMSFLPESSLCPDGMSLDQSLKW